MASSLGWSHQRHVDGCISHKAMQVSIDLMESAMAKSWDPNSLNKNACHNSTKNMHQKAPINSISHPVPCQCRFTGLDNFESWIKQFFKTYKGGIPITFLSITCLQNNLVSLQTCRGCTCLTHRSLERFSHSYVFWEHPRCLKMVLPTRHNVNAHQAILFIFNNHHHMAVLEWYNKEVWKMY
jgi:hypothetical protein